MPLAHVMLQASKLIGGISRFLIMQKYLNLKYQWKRDISKSSISKLAHIGTRQIGNSITSHENAFLMHVNKSAVHSLKILNPWVDNIKIQKLVSVVT